MHLLGKISDIKYVALSGGIDSMFLLNFIKNGKHNIGAVYINHLTNHGYEAEIFVKKYCDDNNIELKIFKIESKNEKICDELHWRNERYKIFKSFDCKIATAHHLNDCIETYLFSAFHGKPKIIEYSHSNVVRPLLLVKKFQIVEYCERYKIPFINDPSNEDLNHPRNRIRHNIISEVKKINPGIEKTISRMIRDKWQNLEKLELKNQ